MTHTVQIVIDCSDPHVLADWWADTLEWTVEPQDETFIRSMIEQGHADESATRMYGGSLVWREATAIRAEADGGPRILFQYVPETKTVKNRVHLDIRVADGDLEKVRDQLVCRGATILHSGQQGPHSWVTMADPEGNEFCV
jgi:hypothetical protein